MWVREPWNDGQMWQGLEGAVCTLPNYADITDLTAAPSPQMGRILYRTLMGSGRGGHPGTTELKDDVGQLFFLSFRSLEFVISFSGSSNGKASRVLKL